MLITIYPSRRSAWLVCSMQVSKLGLGCLGLTGAYNLPLDDEAGAAVVVHAFRRGVTFFDTTGPLPTRYSSATYVSCFSDPLLFFFLGFIFMAGLIESHKYCPCCVFSYAGAEAAAARAGAGGHQVWVAAGACRRRLLVGRLRPAGVRARLLRGQPAPPRSGLHRPLLPAPRRHHRAHRGHGTSPA